MNTFDPARTALAADPETLTASRQESPKTLAIEVTSSPEAPVPLNLQEPNSQIISDCCWSDWQNPLNDF